MISTAPIGKDVPCRHCKKVRRGHLSKPEMEKLGIVATNTDPGPHNFQRQTVPGHPEILADCECGNVAQTDRPILQRDCYQAMRKAGWTLDDQWHCPACSARAAARRAKLVEKSGGTQLAMSL